MSVLAKICGLATAEAIAVALDGGAAMLGFVFYPPSPRALTPERAGALARAVPVGIDKVGLFVDADDATIGATLRQVPLDLLQLHGSESPERVAALKAKFKLPAIKAIKLTGPEDLAEAARFETVADWLLFDAKAPTDRPGALPGGNGLAFDWQLLAGKNFRRPWLLSGGLDASNLAEAVRISGAPAVDVSSGVESAPGVKDLDRIRAFLAVARRL
jgi:phosphoribosylanthranilate isomerase